MKENENNDDRSSLDCHFSSFSHKQILVRRLLLIRHFKQDLSPFSSHQTSWMDSFHALVSISCFSFSSSFSWTDDLSHHYIICILVLSMPLSSGSRTMCEVQMKNFSSQFSSPSSLASHSMFIANCSVSLFDNDDMTAIRNVIRTKQQQFLMAFPPLRFDSFSDVFSSWQGTFTSEEKNSIRVTKRNTRIDSADTETWQSRSLSLSLPIERARSFPLR